MLKKTIKSDYSQHEEYSGLSLETWESKQTLTLNVNSTMHIQLLYIQQLEDNYKLINPLVLTQFLHTHTHTQLHCDSENQTKQHFQMTPTIP